MDQMDVRYLVQDCEIVGTQETMLQEDVLPACAPNPDPSTSHVELLDWPVKSPTSGDVTRGSSRSLGSLQKQGYNGQSASFPTTPSACPNFCAFRETFEARNVIWIACLVAMKDVESLERAPGARLFPRIL